ncbi:MAG TPA: GNAT family N-acetyltransferase [Microthrixaceae bacterium]|nr:GNAT family N-acetyltransferase [Microthrixaceae bacterium]
MPTEPPANLPAGFSVVSADVGVVAEVLGWFETDEEVATWAGTRFGVPLDRARFEAHVRSSSDPAADHWCYALVSSSTTALFSYGELTNLDAELRRADLSRLVVAPAQRGRGVGTALILTLVDEAVRLGMTTIGLRVFAQNRDALRVYERLGFVRTGQHVERTLLGERWDAVELTLDRSSA